MASAGEAKPSPADTVDTSTSSTSIAAGISPLTTTTFTPGVQHQVFNIFELFEHILLDAVAISPRTVLVAQRVSKDWHHVIKHSTPLQQALWFQPCPARLEAMKQRVGTWEDTYIHFNPIIWPKAPAENVISDKLQKGKLDGCESWRRMLVAELDRPTMDIQVHTNGERLVAVWANGKTTVGEMFLTARRVGRVYFRENQEFGPRRSSSWCGCTGRRQCSDCDPP